MDPKLILVAVYKGTQTAANVALGGTVLLQLLSQELAPVVLICGRKTGKTFDKIQSLKKRYVLENQNGLAYFAQAAGLIELKVEQLLDVEGDHILLIGRVVSAKNVHDTEILTTEFLKEAGYSR
jgi:flavin reductase (DIM6/NTAB) family NADH-FMN oxidoreductase RutF